MIKMNSELHKFAIVIKTSLLNVQEIVRDTKSPEKDSIVVPAGTLLKIIDDYGSHQFSVQVIDYLNITAIWHHLNLYLYKGHNIQRVQTDLWPYIIGIPFPDERLKLVQNSELSKNILLLNVNDTVTASGEPFRKDFSYNCIVRYIGLIPEIGPGYYFGLELLDLGHGYSPQQHYRQFARKYMSCDANIVIFLTANWIIPNRLNQAKKFSPLDLLCGTIQKTVDYVVTGRKSSLVPSKREKSIEDSYSATSRTPLVPDDLRDDNNSSSNGTIYSRRKSSVMDKKSGNRRSTASTNTNPSTSSLNIRKDKATNTNFAQDDGKYLINETGSGLKGTSTTAITNKDLGKDRLSNQNENLIVLDNNEEYVRYVENYERGLERQHDIDKQTNIPVSILKPPKSVKKKTTSTTTCSLSGIAVKPNAIMSLQDRDIVVIDNADIKESTRNESEVIVVDNPRTQKKEVDLAEILGTHWPAAAGDAGLVLNNDNKSVISNSNSSTTTNTNSTTNSFNVVRNERNKSVNPISHLVSSKTIDKRINKDNVKIVQTDITLGDGAGGMQGFKNIEKKPKNCDPIYDNANVVSSQIISLTPPEDEILPPSPFSEIPGTNLGVGSMVEVSTDVTEDLYGVIRWIGIPQGSKSVMVGIELEDEQVDLPLTLTDGVNNGIQLFRCVNGRAIFVHPTQCSKDRRFQEIDIPQSVVNKSIKTVDTKMFGQVDCPAVPGKIPPLKILNFDELENICGKFKGIQGHHNSCYLDATLFAMFTFTGVFDSLLFREPTPEDISHYEEVQKVLREEIVNPLRKNIFVRADRVMKLRQLLEKLSSVSGLTCEEKDPEEFLNSLLAQIMRADPLLKLSSGQDTFFYQLFVEKDERLSFPSVQQLFEQSFLASDIKLKEVPSCLIIQMPRFGKNFKMYPRILPSPVLDVTDIIEDSPRQCTVCGKLAEFECRECFGVLTCEGLESTAFCKACLDKVHSHSRRASHTSKVLSVPQDFKIMADHLSAPKLFMELFAVVCIETSHYVAFVKAGPGKDAPWCFFDSMADRKGEQNGYNIPEMVSVPDLPQWLSEEGASIINEASNDKMLPEHAKRLLCDAYMCMYQSTDVMMYR